MAPSLDPSPTTIGQRYQIVRPIARGGMGVVYEVQHLTTGKMHAAKLIQSTQLDPATLLERFHREARSAARIGSRHVVDISDAGLAQELGGTPFIIMERLVGFDFAQLLERRGHLSPDDVVALLAQVASALEVAHRLPLLHRDLKPANLFLHRQPDGEAVTKILDFGLATSVRDLAGDRNVTATGDIMGTPAYMAPEQARGDRDALGPHTDLWAIGMIAFELLSGESYFAGQTTGVIIARLVAAEPARPPSQLLPGFSEGFDRWFARSCHVDLSARFASAMEQVRELAAALHVSLPPQGQRLPASLATEDPIDIGTTAAHVAQHMLGTGPTATAPMSTLKATATTRDEAPRRGLVPAMAVVTGVASLVAIVSVVVLWQRTDDTTPATSSRPSAVAKNPPPAPTAAPEPAPEKKGDMLSSPELIEDAIDELGEGVVLQQIFITRESAGLQARTAEHPKAFFGYAIVPTGMRKMTVAATQKPAAQQFAPDVFDGAVLRSVLAAAKKRFAGRTVIETMVMIGYEGIQHSQIVYRVYKKLDTQENAHINFDVRGKRLGELVDGAYQHADR